MEYYYDFVLITTEKAVLACYRITALEKSHGSGYNCIVAFREGFRQGIR